MNLVLDASVVAKWLLEEEGTREAEALLESCKTGRYAPVAPAILESEVAAVLWKRVMRGLLKVNQAKLLYERFQLIRPSLVPLHGLVRPALELALHSRHSVYDCLYVALSHQMNCGMVTADEQLHRAFVREKPGIFLLREWQPSEDAH